MVTFLTIYVVPRMSDLFSGFGNELPTVTQIVVGLVSLVIGKRDLVWSADSSAARSFYLFGRERPRGRLRSIS